MSGTPVVGRRARAPRRGAREREPARRRRRRSATTTTLGEWWSAQGARGALDRDAQWRAAVALGLLDQDSTRVNPKFKRWLALFALSLPVIAPVGRHERRRRAAADHRLGPGRHARGRGRDRERREPRVRGAVAADRPHRRPGRRAPVLLIGVVAFAIASALCAWSETFGVMMLGRSLQGIASACCFTTSLAAIDALFEGVDSQPMAIGIWGVLGGIGGACGPLVASLLNEAFSWRAFFGVNLILLSVAFVLLFWLVPHLPADRARSVPFVTLVLLMFGIAVGDRRHPARRRRRLAQRRHDRWDRRRRGAPGDRVAARARTRAADRLERDAALRVPARHRDRDVVELGLRRGDRARADRSRWCAA